MKHSVEKKKTSPVIEALPLMANVTVPPAEEFGEFILKGMRFDITGAVESGLNVVNITYQAPRPVWIRFSEKALRALLRLVAEIKLRGGKSIVTALDLQREGVLPWGTACTAMTEVFESIATVLGGNMAWELLDIWAENPGEEDCKWSRFPWNVHFEDRFRLEVDPEDIRHHENLGSTIRQRIGRTRPRRGDRAFLRANGWRPDFAYLHEYTSASEEKSPDGANLAYSLACPSSNLTYNRAALLKHGDDVVRRIAALLPV